MNERLEPRIRILLGSSIAIGPGKAALLDAISETGSIAAAGRRMGMSYRRAWLLAKTMNACFQEPLIEAAKGGTGGGGARLTAMGADGSGQQQLTSAPGADDAPIWSPDGRMIAFYSKRLDRGDMFVHIGLSRPP